MDFCLSVRIGCTESYGLRRAEDFHLGDLTPKEHTLWHQIDDEMLSQELKNLMNGEHEMIPVSLTSEPDFRERPHEEVEEEFYQLAEALVQKMQA